MEGPLEGGEAGRGMGSWRGEGQGGSWGWLGTQGWSPRDEEAACERGQEPGGRGQQGQGSRGWSHGWVRGSAGSEWRLGEPWGH